MSNSLDVTIGIDPDYWENKRPRPRRIDVLKKANWFLSTLQSAQKDIKHAHPFRGEYIRTLSEHDAVVIKNIGRAFNMLVKFMENEISDTVLVNELPAYNISMADTLQHWARLGIIDSPAQWQTISDLNNEISTTGLECSESTAKYLNLLVELVPQVSGILDKFVRFNQS